MIPESNGQIANPFKPSEIKETVVLAGLCPQLKPCLIESAFSPTKPLKFIYLTNKWSHVYQMVVKEVIRVMLGITTFKPDYALELHTEKPLVVNHILSQLAELLAKKNLSLTPQIANLLVFLNTQHHSIMTYISEIKSIILTLMFKISKLKS